jgi:crotonobetaine/carnitine-CoA ligase
MVMVVTPYEKSDWVLGRVLRDKADKLGDKVFLRTREQQITYAQMNSMANRYAAGFSRLGLSSGDKVCLMLDNCLEHYYCWLGLAKAGIVDVPINTAYKGMILEYIINNSEAKVLVVDQAYLDRIQFLEDGLKHIENVIVYSPSGAEPRKVDLQINRVEMDELSSFSDSEPPKSPHYSDLATILYTSGTTGPSKGVMMSHAHCYYFSWVVAENIGLRNNDVDYTCLPLFHANARLMCSYPCLLAEAQVAMARRFSLSGFWKDIQYFQATVFNGLGAIGPLLFSAPPQPEEEDNPVRLAFLVPQPKDHEAFEKRFGLRISTTYGMTEINLPTFNPLDEKLPSGSCGKAIPAFECIIANEHDEELPTGQVGEMLVRSKEPYTMLSGYYNMPDKTAEAYRNLWFHTGDAMYEDENGWFYFVDRVKDAIRRRGENISSFEVETVINSHPEVLESAVVAVKNPELTEDEVKVCLVLQPGSMLTPEELISYCIPRMPYFHVPRYIEIMESLPKTPTDKIRKAVLRDKGLTPDTWDREEAGIKVGR